MHIDFLLQLAVAVVSITGGITWFLRTLKDRNRRNHERLVEWLRQPQHRRGVAIALRESAALLHEPLRSTDKCADELIKQGRWLEVIERYWGNGEISLELMKETKILFAKIPSLNPKKRSPRSLRVFELAGLLFDRETRARVYEPVLDELKEDFLIARRNCQAPSNHRWVKFCFSLRITLAFIRCLRISLMRPLVRMVPHGLKQLWRMFS